MKQLVRKLLRSFSAHDTASASMDTLRQDPAKKVKISDEAGFDDEEIPHNSLGIVAGTSILDLDRDQFEGLKSAASQQLAVMLKKCFKMDKSAINKVLFSINQDNQHMPSQTASFNIFGYPLEYLPEELINQESQIPRIILKVMHAFVYGGGFEREGPFRTEGDKQQLAELVESISQGFEREGIQIAQFPLPVLAAAIKRYMRQIPGSLVPASHASILSKAYCLQDENMRRALVQTTLLTLPFKNAKVLSALLLLLQACASRDYTHKMSAGGLAVCFGPTLFDTGTDLHMTANVNGLLTELILNRPQYASVPSFVLETNSK